MSCCRKCRGSSRQVQGNLQTLENIGGCPVETVCGCQDTSQDTTTNGSSTDSSSSCGCSQQNCCNWNNNCQRTSVTCRSPSPSMNCDDPDVPIVCCGPTNSVDFDSECGCGCDCDCGCSNSCGCDCGCDCDCNCNCNCNCGCNDGCGCNCGCDCDCGCQNDCGCTDARKFRVCCDECGCCRKYPCQWRNPFWPEFAKPRWLCCKDLYNVRG